MKTTTYSLTYGTETLEFAPSADGVIVTHRYPKGLPGYCYRPGVASSRHMSLPAARARYASALASGWVKVAS